MEKIEYLTCIIFLPYFSVPKHVRLNLTHYLIIEINSKRELQNIAINNSADIDYKDVMMICRKCTEESFFFLTIDTTLPASDALGFRKHFLRSYKTDSS